MLAMSIVYISLAPPEQKVRLDVLMYAISRITFSHQSPAAFSRVTKHQAPYTTYSVCMHHTLHESLFTKTPRSHLKFLSHKIDRLLMLLHSAQRLMPKLDDTTSFSPCSCFPIRVLFRITDIPLHPFTLWCPSSSSSSASSGCPGGSL